MRALVRGLVPLRLRRRFAMARRRLQDRGVAFAAERAPEALLAPLGCIASLTQPIHDAPRVAEKRANLEMAVDLMNGLMVAPGEVLSFWSVIGEPSAARGWRAGRTIINDIVSADAGGGLCQLSGLVHHLGVLGGLQVTERWPHSADLYEESQRFMPLGLDATVVYGFKDLRLRNDHETPVWLTFALQPDAISGTLLAKHPPPPCTVELDRCDGAGERSVTATRVWPNGRREMLSHDRYRM